MSWTFRLFMALSAAIIVSLWLWSFDVIGSAIRVVGWTVLVLTVLGWATTAVRLSRTPRPVVRPMRILSLSLMGLGSALLVASLAIVLFIR